MHYTTIRNGAEQSKLIQSICEAEVAQRLQDLQKIQFNMILSNMWNHRFWNQKKKDKQYIAQQSDSASEELNETLLRVPSQKFISQVEFKFDDLFFLTYFLNYWSFKTNLQI